MPHQQDLQTHLVTRQTTFNFCFGQILPEAAYNLGCYFHCASKRSPRYGK
ncbi:hypothetical protein [Nostoc sp. CCY 9925]